MIPPYLRNYLLNALGGTPSVLTALLADLSDGSAAWDARPEADRFTLREITAHLADWEPVARGRIGRTRSEEKPFLPNWDEGAAAVAGRYDQTEPHDSLRSFRDRRAETVALLETLGEPEWHRVAERENVGELSIYTQIVLILAHDGYHLRQVTEYHP